MRFLAFIILFVLIAVMGWATWQEHLNSTQYVMDNYYGTIWFNLLWMALVVSGGYYILKVKLHKKLPVFLLHISLIIILLGALITRVNGTTGMIHLRENVEGNTFISEGSLQNIDLPFSLKLKSFQVEYYPGTMSPSNYVSIVNVVDKDDNKTFETKISMNNILKYKGYRFYQSSFDEDLQGTILSVNHDSTGIGVTYLGYFLLFFSMLWILFDKKGRFIELLKKQGKINPVGKNKKGFKKSIFFVLLLMVSLSAKSADKNNMLSEDGATLSREQADKFARLRVDYHGRICPFQTLAIDFSTKLTGKPRYKYANAEQVLLGWIFFPGKWQHVPLFEINNPKLKRLINNSGNACFADFFHPDKSYKLAAYQHEMYGSEKKTGFAKEALKLDEKIQLIMMLQEGELIRMFPIVFEDGNIRWYGPADHLPDNIEKNEGLFIKNFFPLYYEYMKENNAKDAIFLLEKLDSFQQKQALGTLPSESRFKAELLYNNLNLFSWLFKICLTIGSVAVFFFIFYMLRNKSLYRVQRIFFWLLVSIFVIQTFGLCLRGYVGGRLPMSNGYETMLFVAWCAMLIGLVARRYSFLIVAFSFLLSGFTLLVAHISSGNPQITPLVPVLQSPLLSIHVSLIMMSYGFCGFMLLTSLMALGLKLFAPRNFRTKRNVLLMKELNELFMFPATFFLGAGIFVGAIWANVSWGRYWGWDPKEVWALITFLLMGFTFHSKTLKWLRNPVVYHLFVLLIFLAVLMTYFGVNYVLGGKHSYAG